MGIKVITPGSLTTVQDLGRTGYQALGFPVSGALDLRSARIANILAGNPETDALLEMTLMGGRFEFGGRTVFALAGADMGAKLGDIPVPRYEAVEAKKGDVLTFGFATAGLRAYVAFYGGIDVPCVMGSRSTTLRIGIGGLEGRALRAGDELAFRSRPVSQPGGRLVCERERFDSMLASADCLLHTVPGPQEEYFTEEGIHTFYKEGYRITPDSDRMGIRLKGIPVAYRGSVDIISDGIAFGSVQIPSGGQPIVMLADRQTTGGYAKIGTVASADLGRLVQMPLGGTVRFAPISVKEAAKLAVKEEKEIVKCKRGGF